MLDVHVCNFIGSLIEWRDKEMANDQRSIIPSNAIRHHFGVHRVSGVSGVWVLGVLFKVPLDLLSSDLNRLALRYCLQFKEVL